jgi:hypothetical protein
MKLEDLEDPDFTPRNVAKYAITFTIKHKVVKLIKNATTDYTRFEEDAIAVRLGANVVGWGVSVKLKPLTDKVVDKTADFIVAKREKKSKEDQKDQPETPEEQ